MDYSPYGGISNEYFVVKLYQMVKDEADDILSWDNEGGIIVWDRDRLPLSKYFRHSNFTSFQRQLNNFGFHKKRSEAGGSSFRRSCAYAHPDLKGKSVQAILRLRRFSSRDFFHDHQSIQQYHKIESSLKVPHNGDGYNILSTLADVATCALMHQEQSEISPRPVLNTDSSSIIIKKSLPRPVSMESNSGMGDTSHIQQQTRRLRAFPCILRDLIDESPDSVITWTEDGSLFIVLDPDILSAEILPKYFRHSRLASFQRQLSLYHFRRVRLADIGGNALLFAAVALNSNEKAKILAYRHPLFLRGKSDLELRSLTRSGGSRPRENSEFYVSTTGRRSKSDDQDNDFGQFDDPSIKSDDDDDGSGSTKRQDQGLRPRRSIKRPRTSGQDLYY
uniref:HSF-type DNA-binding domain-containing protein n=1 Tax=Aureoumbra lagunensis TaxID=44058 RepID=A0A7S3K1W0_9STRA|eukprot:CAMPEP_0197315272 /NCGR_PEP_ID=MMETSP0891-20130614/37445_1 /TAXON_ID=44058 ORGANISM="Aureoumbra lagunensis, Strain CCMP1510" /NCGR_SAMPLE_ID=MMETSP0891 /ASSEMBLY_ACC=CAM_ASM_000534 /LENGTH=390 /DNA_ID=CAMNT_0042804135 /DNA_START=15 /DNA_END=1187 /DNA_ORIENTATION=-